jgi:hypothetical protein
MKTKYQRILEMISSIQKVSKRVSSDEMLEVFFEFIKEAKADIESGVKLRQTSALQKLMNIKEVIDQLKVEGAFPSEEDMPEELKGATSIIREHMKEKLDSVIKSINEYMR